MLEVKNLNESDYFWVSNYQKLSPSDCRRLPNTMSMLKPTRVKLKIRKDNNLVEMINDNGGNVMIGYSRYLYLTNNSTYNPYFADYLFKTEQEAKDNFNEKLQNAIDTVDTFYTKKINSLKKLYV